MASKDSGSGNVRPENNYRAKKASTPEKAAFVQNGSRAIGTSLSHYSIHARMGYLESPDFRYLQKYEIAFRSDPIINRALNFIKLSMTASLGAYIHTDSRCQEYVHRMMNRMEGNLLDELGQLVISGLWAGYGVSECMYVPADGLVWLQRMANYHPRSCIMVPNVNGIMTDNEADATHPIIPRTGIWQELPWNFMKNKLDKRRTTFANYVRLPLDKIVYVTNNKRHGNWQGESALAPVWLRYQMIIECLQNMMITTERYGSPQLAAIVPNGVTSQKVSDGNNGFRFKTIAEAAQETLANLSTTSALVFEEPIGLQSSEKVRLQSLSSFNNFGDNFLKIISQMYGDLLVGLGVPPLLFMEHSGGLGAGAIAQVHAQTYKQFVTALYTQFVEPFVEQVIGRLLFINFGVTDPGRFEFNPFDIAAADTIMKTFEMATHNGYVDPSIEEDLQLVRSRLGLPLASLETVNERIKKNSTLMAFKREPGRDKFLVAKVRHNTSMGVAEIHQKTAIETAKLTGNTQLGVAEINNGAHGPKLPGFSDNRNLKAEEANKETPEETPKKNIFTNALNRSSSPLRKRLGD